MIAAQITRTRLLQFESDIGLRKRYFPIECFSHPAKMHLGLLQWITDRYTQPGDTVMDPMAGSGSCLYLATQQRHVIARDVEPHYLALMHTAAARILDTCGLFAGRIDVGQADARQPWGVRPDCVVMSPPYGCAASSHPGTRTCLPHRFREPAKMTPRSICTVTFFYGEHPAQVGHLRSVRYWDAMGQVYRRAAEALPAGGLLVLVLKNHVRDGRIVPVVEDTVALCGTLGFALVERHARLVRPLSLWQRRRKERGEPIVEEEDVLVLQREVTA